MAEILLVEDDSDVAESLRLLLEDWGHKVRSAGNGHEGMVALADWLPDLVLLDVEMPVLDGPGMALRMFLENAGKERLPVVLVSGASNLRTVAQQVGTPYAIAKPFSVEALEALVRRALEERLVPVPQTKAAGTTE